MPPRKKKTSTRPRKKPEPMTLKRWLMRHPVTRFVFVLLSFWVLLGFVITLLVLFHYERKAAKFDLTVVGRIPMETRVLGGGGEQMGYLHGEEVGMPVPLEQISPHFLNALIAREDSRFYDHGGVDYVGLVRAWLRNFKEKRLAQGASTITMQLTRMTFLLTEKSYKRKLLEMALARRIENHFSKDEILHQYVNRVFLGTGMNGVEQAAQGYFGKPASDLNLSEAAMIAGIIRAPNGFSPFRHPDASLREMRTTLARMVDEGTIEAEEAEAARVVVPQVLSQDRWLQLLAANSKVTQRSYVMDMIERKLDELLPEFSATGGLTVWTTFDMRVQEVAERAMENGLRSIEALGGYSHPRIGSHIDGDPRYLQGACVVLENGSGALRAVVGGRQYGHSAFNRTLQSNRQAGSVFKPLVYGTAFEMGMFPGTLISDAEIQPGEIDWDNSGWNPTNSDGIFNGELPAEEGLIRSRNTMSVRVGEWAGIENVLNMMEHAGIGEADDITPRAPIYIGTIGASVLDLTSAYSIFAKEGIRYEPYYIESVVDRDGTVLYTHEITNYRVLSSGAAWITSNILKRAVEEGGTGAELRKLGFQAPAGGKTGTTNDFFDAWFVGYSSRLTAGVWVGLDQPETIIKGAYGGKVAVPIWKDIMTGAGAIGYEFGEFAQPEEVISMNLCRQSGKLATEACEAHGSVYVEKVPHDLIPREFCEEHE